MSEWNRIAHPEWINDAVSRMDEYLRMDMGMKGGLPQRAFMLSTPAHRMLRAIYGGYWSVCWWAFKRALETTFNEAMPHQWHQWRYRRLYGEEIAATESDEP